MPSLALARIACPLNQSTKNTMEQAVTILVALFVIALFVMVASSTYSWLSSGTR